MSKSAQLPRIRSKARPASQRPQLVERELERAQLRLRTVDTIYSICLLAGGVLTYLLIIIGLDYWLHLKDGVRQALWAVAGIGALAFIGWKIAYPLLQHINPYYTARMIEKATPGSKNGIINWLDLRNEKINPIVRDSLSRRAVHELDSANMEEAIPTRKPIRTGIILGVILLAIIFVAFVLPDQIGSLFKRALFPFKSTIIPTHTRLEVLKPVEEPVPEEDVSTMPIREVMVERGQPVEFRVLTHGKIPEEVVMESQAAGDRLPMVKPLRQDKSGDSSQPWRVALSSSDIPVDGFEFWFRANDGMTRKFKLVVVSRVPPSVSDLEVKLNYPAYTKRRPTIQGMGPIRAIQDTVVDLEVTADRPAASGELEVIEEQMADDGRIIANRRQTIKLVRPVNKSDDNRLALAEPLRLIPGYVSKDDKKQKFFYQLALVSPENLTGLSPKYPLEVTSNLAPRVEIQKIKDTTLAKDQNELEVEANAVLPVSGIAHDDIAVGQVSFKLKTSDGRDLYFVGKAPMEKNLQKANGFTSPPVPFLLTLDLSKLTYDNQSENAKPIQLKPGTIVEMVVEAADTSEPVAQVGVSQLIRLKLKGEANQEQRNEQQKQADKQKQQHEQQKKEREQQQPENNQQEKNEDQQGDKGDKQQGEKSEKQSGEKGNQQSGEKGEKQSGEKSEKQTGEKGDKQSGDKGDSNEKQGEKGDKQSGNKNEKGDKQSGDKSDKQSGDKGDSNEKQGEKGDKQSGNKNEKGDKQASEKQGSEKGDKQANEKGDKQSGEQSSEKQSGDKSEKGDKQSGDKGDMNEKQGDKGDKQSGNKNEKGDKQASEKQGSEKGDKQANEKGDKQSGEQSSEKQSGDKNEKGDKQGSEKGDKQANEKGDKQTGEQSSEKQSGDKNEKGDKESRDKNEKSDKQGNEKEDKQANEKGDKQTGEQASEKQSGDKNEKGDKESRDKNEKGDKQGSEKGDKQANEKGDKQAGDKQGSEKGDKGDMNEKQGDKSAEQPGEKQGDKQGDKPSEKTSKDKGMPGSGQGTDPQDKGDLSKILEQVSKDNRAPEKSNFNAKPAAAKDDQKGQEVDQEAARKRELALDSLAEKLKRGDIDRKLADKMKELNLTKEEALKMVQNQQLQRVRGTGKQSDQGPGKTLTSGRRTTEQIIDPATDVPDELSSSYQRFTEKRNQPKR
ncbi:MAG: hypothetical protein JNJ77_04695 [Planctomycetia bacterium]|nr:hypothetical protein [Planctomycetia bacterium]